MKPPAPIMVSTYMRTFISRIPHIWSIDILQSDHGLPIIGVKKLDSRVPEKVVKALSKSVRRLSAAGVDNLGHALLAVKPPERARIPFQTSDITTQLLDIAPTIYDVVGLQDQKKACPGHSLLDPNIPKDRNIQSFLCIKQISPDGTERMLGKDGFLQAQINHFSYSQATGWVVHPDVDVTW